MGEIVIGKIYGRLMLEVALGKVTPDDQGLF